MGIDLVKLQLQIAQGARLSSLDMFKPSEDFESVPRLHSVQLRITAENPEANWSLSVGKISTFQFPTGNGIRVDTHMLTSKPTVIGTEFDSLLAKIIVTAPTWKDVVAKCKRALADTRIEGIKTSLDALRGIISSPDFDHQECDTQWLESKMPSLLSMGKAISAKVNMVSTSTINNTAKSLTSSPTSLLIRKGDTWSITITPEQTVTAPNTSKAIRQTQNHHLEITRVQSSEFPTSLNASILYTAANSQPLPYQLILSATKMSASAHSNTQSHRKGDSSNLNHIITPFPGRLVEILVDEGDQVKKGDTVAVVRQMKMEVDIRANRDGAIEWVFRMEEDEEVEVGEGDLIVVLRQTRDARL
jgi:pyruvate carboxylase